MPFILAFSSRTLRCNILSLCIAVFPVHKYCPCALQFSQSINTGHSVLNGLELLTSSNVNAGNLPQQTASVSNRLWNAYLYCFSSRDAPRHSLNELVSLYWGYMTIISHHADSEISVFSSLMQHRDIRCQDSPNRIKHSLAVGLFDPADKMPPFLLVSSRGESLKEINDKETWILSSLEQVPSLIGMMRFLETVSAVVKFWWDFGCRIRPWNGDVSCHSIKKVDKLKWILRYPFWAIQKEVSTWMMLLEQYLAQKSENYVCLRRKKPRNMYAFVVIIMKKNNTSLRSVSQSFILKVFSCIC